MRSILLFCFMVCALVIGGCNQKPGEQKAGTVSNTEQKMNADSLKSVGGHDYTFLTYKMLLYRNSVTMGKDATYQPYEGQWIKLDSDGTFKSGKYKDQLYTGKWNYNHDAGIILLQSENKNYPTSEWKVIYNDDMVVFIGTPTYGNSNTQIQLVRIDKFPEKKG